MSSCLSARMSARLTFLLHFFSGVGVCGFAGVCEGSKPPQDQSDRKKQRIA